MSTITYVDVQNEKSSFADNDYIIVQDNISSSAEEADKFAAMKKCQLLDLKTYMQQRSDYTLKEIQNAVRNNTIDSILAIGDVITVEKGNTATVSTSSGLSATINAATFFGEVKGLHQGSYIFSYSNGWKCYELEGTRAITLSDYGITLTGTPASGATITVTVTTDKIDLQYVAKDKVTLVNPNLTHSVVFQMKHCYSYNQWDAPEAIIYANTAMSAGTYHFNLYKPSNIYYLNAGLQNKNVQFTTTITIPAGGQLVLTTGSFNNSTSVSDLKLTSYGSRGATTALESNIACSEGTSGTDLGYANKADNASKINSTDRCVYGNNRWKDSAVRQWMNSADVAGSWWTPQSNFDRKPSNADSVNGFLYGMDAELIDVLQKITSITTQNWFDGGSTETTDDFFIVPSMSQVYMTATLTEGACWDYYQLFSDLSSAGIGADSNRIKKGSNGTGSVAYWWLRTPNTDASCREYFVRYTGNGDTRGVSDNGAVSPACVIA